MTTSAPPSLIPGGQPAFSAHIAAGPGTEHTLMDLMYDGFYALFMLKNGNGPQANTDFINKMTQFLDDFSAAPKSKAPRPTTSTTPSTRSAPPSTRSSCARRTASATPGNAARCNWCCSATSWPARISSTASKACARGSAHLQALEVFHMCLLLGFQGRYIIEGSEKLRT
jgi:type VI secretion system protein ImpK